MSPPSISKKAPPQCFKSGNPPLYSSAIAHELQVFLKMEKNKDTLILLDPPTKKIYNFSSNRTLYKNKSLLWGEGAEVT